MIKLIGDKLPRKLYVACSGGVDSMAVADFLRRNHDVDLVFFDHGTATSNDAKVVVSDFASKHNLGYVVGHISREKDSNESREEYWRNERYKFFTALKYPVITAHHLNDAVETWVWSSMHGTPKLPLHSRENIIRPFLATPKATLVDWAVRHDVPWIEDETNSDETFTRNYIRHTMMPHILHVNPGIEKVIAKKVIYDVNSR